MKKIFLQGLPGVGKTTLTKQIVNKLNEMGVDVTGFYTEELRDSNNYRLGFDVVSLDDKRGALARKSSGKACQHKVGTYDVHLDEFENIVLPIFNKLGSVVVIDEIGKMELFSKKFEVNVEKVIADSELTVLATIPLKGGIPFVQKIKNNKQHHLITVTAANRNVLLEEVISMITS